ncbi:uncharacterized protein LDX57_009209 [Aspergillus melleus]|uniref:uncharacterized protein n=1 Tax=Aspergillus melleus TaxID=138277 RepID=UPI001E8DF645|nr:uncharacterized protein LDX57_009209 [Aspergillus melleus]KAH8431547.1 hypothetical protein LDX57_009209 [Aspergillus melleus]
MARPTLEGLPVELMILILFRLPDGNTFKSLVYASPDYHQAYLTVRYQLLRLLVRRQLGGLLDLAEVFTAIRSQGVHYAYQDENVIALLDNWRRKDEIRELKSSKQPDEPDSPEEIIKRFRFYRMLFFFLEDISINAPRPPWIQPIQWESEYLPLHLSIFEKRRFLRAMCRFQILKNLFGDPVYCFDRVKCGKCGDRNKFWQLRECNDLQTVWEEAYRLFYGTMPLWEHDEMGSVFMYLVSKYEGISKEITDDLRQLSKNTSSRFFWDILPKEQRPPPCEIESERDLFHFNQHYEGLAGLGPEFLYRILHMDWLTRRNLVCVNTRSFWPGPFIGYGTEILQDIQFQFIGPADRYECPNFEQFWSTLSPLEQPTVGWKKAWLRPHNQEDILEDSFNFNRELDEDWGWCYALWDENRLKEWKAPLVVEQGSLD